MGLFSFLFSGSITTALERGAKIVDIRTAVEYDGGHVPGAHNIPVDRLQINLPRIKSMRNVIICGSGDERNSQAVGFLKNNGVESVLDGGSWERLYRIWKKV
ncbi:MAG: rhodanese-like domain-containing protein [Chitinophagaceae bacterium]